MELPSPSPGAKRGRSALLQYRQTEGLGELVVTGTLSPGGAASARFEALNHVALDERLGLVVDLRQASFALDSDAVAFRCFDCFRAMDRLHPIAVVVKPELETWFLQWAWEMAHEGLVRSVFTQIEEARAWVRSRTPPVLHS